MGIACGVVLAAALWLVTAVLILKGGSVVGPNLGLLSQFFHGYSVTWKGSVVALAWGFGIGYVGGWLFAGLRNLVFRVWLAFARSRAEFEEYGDILNRL